jgi:VanZ family protein
LLRAIGRVTPAFVLAAAFAVTDEIHQAFVPGRQASPLDVAIDVTGIAVGLALATRIRS